MSGQPTLCSFARGDLTYRLDHPRTRLVVSTVLGEGHEIGLHGSFATYESADAFRAERDGLSKLAGYDISGVRQHFLRMRPMTTQREMASASFSYDASFGFPDRNGFRLGTADIVRAWDAGSNQALSLDLVPLTWMDRALSKYQGVQEPQAWIDDAIELAIICREVEGLWVGLWHPNLSRALGYPGALRQYERLLQQLAQMDPYVGTLSEIVRWRGERRNLRARRVASDGRVDLDGSQGVRLEEPTRK
jgi:hypothetical protein